MYQANMLQQVMTQQDSMQQNLQTIIDNQVKASLAAALTSYTSDESSIDTQSQASSVPEMNNITTTDATKELLKLIDTLTKNVDQLSPPKSTNKN